MWEDISIIIDIEDMVLVTGGQWIVLIENLLAGKP